MAARHNRRGRVRPRSTVQPAPGVEEVEALEEVGAIVVPLDGSAFAEVAVLEASELAQRLGATVHLFSAIVRVQDLAERRACLAAVDVIAPAVHREIVVDRDTAGAVHEAVRRLAPAVVCMASHGRGRSAALVGSVATEIVERGHDSLVLVGPELDQRLCGSGVVACIDETPASQSIIPVALRWSELLREPLTVITVAEDAPEMPTGTVRRAFGPDGNLESFLDIVVAPLRAAGRDVRTVPIYEPVSPTDGICSYIEDHPAALVAVSSHARSGLARIASGSVAAGVVHRSRSPVLVSPLPDTP
jgi:nucleotide-binding universal stress UspA family protein